ncbi:MAG: WecB/TagA/CpsF family glycosyltransferase [Patescibacteria group bacterium]|nr:WecB/TagA/CpsF family glycosyltransferase [Patescibacteria group bacterium]
MNQARILDVKINEITITEVLEKIKSFLLSDQQYYIVTLNPEMIVEAQENYYFKKIVNEADLVIPDGIGIVLANRFLNNQILSKKITGIDLIYKICESEFVKDKRIYLLGAGEEIAEKTAKVLSKKYDDLNIVGAEEGIRSKISNFQFPISNKFSIFNFKILRQVIKRIEKVCDDRQKILKQVQNDNQIHISCNNLIQRINKAQPDIIFVAFGAPKQEEWICKNLKKMPSVKLAIGVGGSFDFISGKVKRAPLIFQKLWLEWLWRLILEPRRVGRIYNATVKFSWLVLKRSFKCRYKNIK